MLTPGAADLATQGYPDGLGGGGRTSTWPGRVRQHERDAAARRRPAVLKIRLPEPGPNCGAGRPQRAARAADLAAQEASAQRPARHEPDTQFLVRRQDRAFGRPRLTVGT